MTDRARYRLPASTTVDPTVHGSTSARTAADPTTHGSTSARSAADPTMHGRRSGYARSPIRTHTRAKPSKHSHKFKHAPQIWPTQQQDPPCAIAKQSNATAKWKNMTVDPTTHGTNRARTTSDRTTHDGKTKQTRSQRRPPKSQSRSKTVANRPRNRRSKHAQSPTLPPHATAAPNTK